MMKRGRRIYKEQDITYRAKQRRTVPKGRIGLNSSMEAFSIVTTRLLGRPLPARETVLLHCRKRKREGEGEGESARRYKR